MGQALLVIDVQQLLVDALDAARRVELLETLADVIERARGAAVPVVYVRHASAELVPQTPAWEIAARISPRAGEPIVEKRYCDAFRATDLAQILSGLAADALVVCGMQTEYCVDSTLREAERRGYRVTLVADGHATFAAGGLTEAQIRDHVHRVAGDGVATIVPADALVFEPAGARANGSTATA